MQNKDILVLGNGFIGTRFKEYYGCQNEYTPRIEKYKDIEDLLNTYTYAGINKKVIINCIGSVGHNNTDDCEYDIDKTLFANTYIPILLTEYCRRYKIKLVHISSGCLFGDQTFKPINEEQRPDFYKLFYSRTKIYAENALKDEIVKIGSSNTLIVRIRIPLDNKSNRRNLLNKLIKYKKVIDVPNSITYIPDLLKITHQLIEKDFTGIFNVVNDGALKYKELLDVYKKHKQDFNYEVVEYNEVVKTPRTNIILSTNKLKRCKIEVRDIHDILDECVTEYLNEQV
jgi:3,5-epimerase/4-reductase